MLNVPHAAWEREGSVPCGTEILRTPTRWAPAQDDNCSLQLNKALGLSHSGAGGQATGDQEAYTHRLPLPLRAVVDLAWEPSAYVTNPSSRARATAPVRFLTASLP